MKKSTKSGGSKLGNKAGTSVAKPALTAANRREQLGKRGGDLARFAQPLKPKVAVAANTPPATT